MSKMIIDLNAKNYNPTSKILLMGEVFTLVRKNLVSVSKAKNGDVTVTLLPYNHTHSIEEINDQMKILKDVMET